MARILSATAAAAAAAVVAGCPYDARPLDDPDAGQNRPDGSGPPDADLTVPDAREVPDAPPNTPDAPPHTPDAHVALCPASYTSVGGSHYRWVGTGTNWLAAELDCEDDATGLEQPTHLAVVDDAGERSILITGTGGSLDNQWIGRTDLAAEGSLIYITPQAGVDGAGASGNSGMKDCVRMGSDGSYAARDCTNTNIYVCECDGFAADVTRFPNYPNGN